MKLHYWILGTLAILFIVLAGGATVLMETQAGLRWTIGLAESYSGGSLAVGTAGGHLAGPFTLKDVRLKVKHTTIALRQVRIDWHPAALLRGTVHIGLFDARGVVVATNGGTKRAGGTGAHLPSRIHLPVAIRIDRARVQSLRWQGSGRAVSVSEFGFALDASSRRASVKKLRIAGPGIFLAGTLAVQPRGAWKISGRIAGHAALKGYPQIAGRTRVRGALRGTVRVDQSISAPFQAEIEARVSHLFGVPDLHGQLRLAHFNPRRLKGTWPDMPVSAEITLDGTLRKFVSSGTLTTLIAGSPQRFGFAIGASVNGNTVDIAHLNLVTPNAARLTVKGTLSTQAPYPADLHLAWNHLQWPLGAAPAVARAANGTAHLAGTPSHWRLDVVTLLKPGRLPQGRWALEASGTRDMMNVQAMAGLWLGGRFNGHGRIFLDTSHPTQMSFAGRGIRLSELPGHQRGQVRFDLAASGRVRTLQGRLEIKRLAGQWNGHAIRGKASLLRNAARIDLQSLQVALGHNHLHASGTWARTLNVSLQLDAPHLDEVEPRIGGALNATARVSGNPAAPTVHIKARGKSVRWKSLNVASAQMEGTVDISSTTVRSLTLQASNVTDGTLTVSKLSTTLSGPAQDQTMILDMTTNRGSANLSARGHSISGGWIGRIISGQFQPLKSEPYRLQRPARIQFTKRNTRLDRNCWRASHGGGFCLSGQSSPGGWQIKAALASIPLGLANSYLGHTVSLEGRMAGTLQAGDSKNGLKLLGELHVGPGSITRTQAGNEHRFKFSEAGIEASLNPLRAEVRVGLVMKSGGLLNAALDTPWRKHKTPTGRLRLRAVLPDLSGLAALSPDISNVTGRLDANIEMQGSLDSPRLIGQVRLDKAGLTLGRYGTRITDAHLLVKGTGNGLQFSGQAGDNNKGRISLRGSLRHQKQWRLVTRIQGNHFRAANMPEATINLSPHLLVTVQGHAVSVRGAVTIPSAHIHPPHFSGAIAPTPDLVIAGEKKSSQSRWALTAELHIQLGKRVHFTGYGLEGRVGGQLNLHDQPGKLTTASGELKILDGTYRAYGQDLTIDHGRLLFSGGPVTNPGLDMRASRKIGMVTAGLQITGSLRSPQLQVFSDPPMTQSNALAYLLFGHGVNQTSGAEQSTLNRAANAIGIAGGTLIAKAIGRQVGVDTVSVENASPYSTNASQASLFLGKYLSPRLYVSYGIGLYEPISLFRIRYTLSRHWALEAESGTISGADILYTIGH